MSDVNQGDEGDEEDERVYWWSEMFIDDTKYVSITCDWDNLLDFLLL